MFKSISNLRTFEAITQQIRNKIESQELRPGDKLPAERDLALQFGVSRNAVREALRTLESAGILMLQKGAHGGAFVRKGDHHNVTQSLRDLLALGTITLDELTEVRMDIMRLILEHSSLRATEDDFAALEKNVAQLAIAISERKDDVSMRLTAEFYLLLAESTRNRAYVLLMVPLADAVRRFVTVAGIRATQEVVDSRKEMIASLRAHDANKAIEILNHHLGSVHKAILRRFPDSRIYAEHE